MLPQISKATLSEETPHSSSSLKGFEQQQKFKNKHVNANKVCTSDLFWFILMLSNNSVFGSTPQINSHPLEGGESLFVYKGIKLCRFSSGVEEKWPLILRTLGSDFHKGFLCRGGKMRVWNSHCATSVIYLGLRTECVFPWCVVFTPVVLEAVLGFLNG